VIQLAGEMTPPETFPRPSFAVELRRGLNAYNLRVGALTGAGGGIALGAATASGAFPMVVAMADPRLALLAQSAVGALATFVFTTALHTAVHAYFGWRFGRGIAASEEGRHAEAIALLSPVTMAGMDHYDPGGHASRALETSRTTRP
jgi:hypothetical protein